MEDEIQILLRKESKLFDLLMKAFLKHFEIVVAKIIKDKKNVKK